MIIPLLAAGLLVGGTARAQSYELAGEFGTFRVGDPSYDRFSYPDALPSTGLRAGRVLGERITLVGSWHHSRRRGQTRTDDVILTDNRLAVHEIGLGARVHQDLVDTLRGYAGLSALALWGRARIVGDRNLDADVGEVRRSALAPGFLAVLGVHVHVPIEDYAVMPVWTLEGGYGWTTPLSFDPLGDIQPRGFVLRAGFGFAF